jgi:hypothetical protein
MRFQPWVVFVSIILGSFYVGSCNQNDNSTPLPAKRHCANAMECFSIVRGSPPVGIICPINEQVGIRTNLYWSAYDFYNTNGATNNDYNIFAEIQETQTPNNGTPPYKPNPVLRKILAGPPNGATPTGGPDNIDYPGPPFPLGCEYQFSANPANPGVPITWHITYAPVLPVCFEENDPNCTSAQPGQPLGPQQPPDVLATCEARCKDTSGESCSEENVSLVPDAAAVVQSFARAVYSSSPPPPPPITLNIVSLLQLLALPPPQGAPPPSPVCSGFTDMTIDNLENVTAVGDRCTFRFRLGDKHPPYWYAVLLNAPALISGVRTTGINQGTIMWDKNATVTARIFAPQDDLKPKSELITALRAEPGKLLLAGEEQFCALVKW